MTPSTWFNDLPVLGALPPEQAAARLRQLGEVEAAAALENAAHQAVSFKLGKRRWPFTDRPWQHTAHAFGYLAPAGPGAGPQPLRHAGDIAPDPSLKNGRIKITLDRLRVADYPGGGTHRVLFDFYAQNQAPGVVEHLHFNSTCRVREGELAGIIGQPIFVGLNVGAEGVAFKCFTVNVKNDDDEALLGFLESDEFKVGLQLVSTVQPAIKLLSGMALGLTRTIAARNRNVPVQEFQMGLDFGATPTGARLAQGSYLAVQIPETFQTVWDWSEWVYNPANGRVVSADDPTQLIPYNYLVFGVGRYRGE